MEIADSRLRSALDFLGLFAYLAIVGGGIPDQDMLSAAHPNRSGRLARGMRNRRPRLRVIPPSAASPEASLASAPPDERLTSAA